jgi:hypothetical protein
MPEAIYCGECGAILPPYWPKALCARCALDGVLDLPEADPGTSSNDEPSPSSGNQPPPAGPPTNSLGVVLAITNC